MQNLLAILAKASPFSLLFCLYGVMSLITFIIYWWDKTAAKNNTWRVQESTLHLLALLGGWPGALLAQNRLRHKTRKQPFRMILWCMIMLHGLVVLTLFSLPSVFSAI